MWRTILDWNGHQWIVSLLRDNEVVAEMPLDDWANLSANQYLINDRLRQSA